MKLSIVIVSWNTKQLTHDCINSIFKYPPIGKFEVILVDNGSTDGTLSSTPKKVIVIKNKKNLGFSKANNQGIKKAKGDYVLLLNSDTKVTKNALSSLLNFAKSNSDAGVVGTQLLNSDKTIQPSVFHLPTLGRAIKEFWLGGKKYLNKYYPKGNSPIEVEAVVGAAFLITPKALDKSGMLNEKYFMFFEDLEYCKKVREAGLRVFYLPESKIFHCHGASGENLKSNNDQWKRLIPSSKIYHGLVKYYLIQFIIKSSQKLSLHVNK